MLAMEVLEVTNRVKKTSVGLGTLLEMAFHDNKGRLSFTDPVDTAADTVAQPAFIIYVRCIHGHHANLAETFSPEEIAVGWLIPYSSAELEQMDRLFIPFDKAPPRLYRRTMHDLRSAFLLVL